MSRYIITNGLLKELTNIEVYSLFEDIEEAYDQADPGQTVIRLEQEDTKVK